MSENVPINSARRTVSFAAADVYDADGVRTSFATVASPHTTLPAAMNGAAMDGSTGRFAKLPRTVVIVRSNNANQFSTSGIVITGTRGGATVTETLTPANDDGNDTLRGSQVFDSLVSIAFQADGGTGGTYTIGVQNIAAPTAQDTFSAVELTSAAGTINAKFGSAHTDAKPAAQNQVVPMAPTQIDTNPTLTAPTTAALTVYLP